MKGLYTNRLKRFFDVAVSLLSLALLSWLFLLIMLCFALLREFPVFFRQRRIGRDEKPFTIVKFRTLSVDTDASLTDRQFRLGKILRATNLDELPQLWNVLTGDMSLVGPRPLPVEYLPLFSESQRRRHRVRPGITGWAQVNGRHSISWPEKFKLDIHYVDHLSFALDVRILVRTLALMVSPVKDVSLREKPFAGEE